MKIAVIGGSGFIGTRLVARLRTEHDVRIIDIRKSRTFPELWAAGDVRQARSWARRLAGVDCLVNLAAEHKDNVRPINLYYDVNVEGARALCETAARCGIGKIVFTSSVAVYGAAPDRSEQNDALLPNNHYGKSKWEAEKIYRQWQLDAPGRNLLIIRPTVVFGENNRGNVFNLLRQIHAMPSLMVGLGTNIKSMAYVENLVAFIAGRIDRYSGSLLFNYVDKPDLSMRQLSALVRKIIGGTRLPVIHFPYLVGAAIGRMFDFLHIVSGREFPISAIRMKKLVSDSQFPAGRLAAVRFIPPYTLAEGIKRTIRHEFSSPAADRIIFESE